MLAILDESQLELVEFQLGDQSKGRLQRLPREAERATGDEHPTLLFRPPQGSIDVAVDSLLAFAVERHDSPVPGGSTDVAGFATFSPSGSSASGS